MCNQDADALDPAEGDVLGCQRETPEQSCVVQTPETPRYFLHENRETSEMSVAGADRRAKA